jgi:signal transduction histidine kinase
LLEEARQVRQAAESAAQNRNELLALVAHDLRNPINTLQLSLSALLRTSSHQDDEKLMRQLQRMGRAASSMEQFIDCLCDVIRIQSGSLQVDLDSEELTSILERSLQALGPRAAERSQTLMVDVPLGLRVRADRDRLMQALTHVVDDAIRSTPTQGWIRLCGRRLSEGRGSMVEIAVADSGPAISAEELPRIFDHPGGGPLHSTRGRRLGLVVAKGIVEAHGGTLLVESSTGVGAVFRLTLPAAE